MPDTEAGTYQKINDYRERILSWLFQQGISTVILTAQTASILWIGWYVVDKLIPQSIEHIHSGYERTEQQHEKDLKLVLDSFEKAMNHRQNQLRKSSTSPNEISEDLPKPFPCG